MRTIKLILLIIMFGVFSANAQEPTAEQSQEELAKKAANPVANLMSFPFQNNLNMNQGPYDRNTNILNIQPVIPFFNGKLMTRTVLPIVSIPDYGNETGKLTSGLADIVFSAFYVPESKGLIWGFGPVFELPTGGAMRGTQKWSVGPSAVLMVQPGDWTIGVLANNAWSFAGKSGEGIGDVNHMLVNLFVVRQLGGGWYVNSAPIITADWMKDSDKRWIVPLGAGAGKVMMLGGKLPLNVQTGLYYNVVRPDNGPKMQWRVQAQFLLPTTIFKGSN